MFVVGSKLGKELKDGFRKGKFKFLIDYIKHKRDMGDDKKHTVEENMFGECAHIFKTYESVIRKIVPEVSAKPVKWDGKCCGRCVHRYGDKAEYCGKHFLDDTCFKFKLEKL